VTGLIDVHSHLLPGVDDGCESVEESLACARRLVENGYSHSFCTPHVWPNLPGNSVGKIPLYVNSLQAILDKEGIGLKLMPGGEMNIHPRFMETPAEELVTYGMGRKYALADLWVDKLPDYFFESVRWMQQMGLTVILAHPERMRAVQDEPEIVETLAERGILLQGNLQCLGDPPHKQTRRVAEKYLAEGRYFMLGSDLHRMDSLEVRLAGLRRAREVVGEEGIGKLMVENPKMLME
jgi:protein-tyrosine phosphatase